MNRPPTPLFDTREEKQNVKHTPALALAPVTPETADDRARGLLQDARERPGFVPNMYANMATSAAAA